MSRKRVNGKNLYNFHGDTVSVIGKIDEIIGSTKCVLMAADNKKLTVEFSSASIAPLNTWVEIIGTVTGADKINGTHIISFDDKTFHKEGYQAMMSFVDKCEHINRCE